MPRQRRTASGDDYRAPISVHASRSNASVDRVSNPEDRAAGRFRRITNCAQVEPHLRSEKRVAAWPDNLGALSEL